jgi:hypothetical protein
MAVWMRSKIGERVKVTLVNYPDDVIRIGTLIAAVDDDAYGGIAVVESDGDHIICRGDRTVIEFEH